MAVGNGRPTALPARPHTRLQALRYEGFCSSPGHHYYDLLRLPARRSTTSQGRSAYRFRRYRARGLAHHDLNLPVPRRISPVPRRTA